MGACSAQNFSNVTQDVWNKVVQTAKSDFGIDITSHSGQVSDNGFTITWNYDPGAQKATVQCTDSPFFVPCSLIDGKIESIAVGCGAHKA